MLFRSFLQQPHHKRMNDVQPKKTVADKAMAKGRRGAPRDSADSELIKHYATRSAEKRTIPPELRPVLAETHIGQ